MSSLPARLRRASAIISRSNDFNAAAAQDAVREVTARLVLLEETLHAVLCNEEGAREKAWRLLVTT